MRAAHLRISASAHQRISAIIRSGEDMYVLLGAVVVCVVAAAGFLVVMFRRDRPHLGAVGLAGLMLAGVLSAVYGALASM